MSKSKAKGSAWEVRVRDFFRTVGFPHCERLAGEGRNDRGDLTGIGAMVIEAKNCRKVELGAWMDEAEAEAKRAGVPRFAVVFPRRNHRTEKAYALVPLWLLAEFMLPDDVGGTPK